MRPGRSCGRYSSGSRSRRRWWRGGAALRTLIVALAIGFCLLHATATPQPVAAACGFSEMYGPFGAITGSSLTATLAQTSCLPDVGVSFPALNIDTRPQIDWGAGAGFEDDAVFVNDRSDCVAGCRIGGSHTYFGAGVFTVKVKYYVLGVSVEDTVATVYVAPGGAAPNAPSLTGFGSTVPTNQNQPNQGPHITQPPNVDLARWMEQLHQQIGDLPLNEIVLPGSHDSGTFAINSDSLVSPDFPPQIADQLGNVSGALRNGSDACSPDPTGICPALLSALAQLFDQIGTSSFQPGGQLSGVLSPIGDSVAGDARAQDLSLLQQLQGGIRVLDIRLCVDTSAPDLTAASALRFCHSMYGDRAVDDLPDIRRFIEQSSPHELVFLDLHNTMGQDGAINSSSSEPAHENLITWLRQEFSSDGSCATPQTCLLVPSTYNASNTYNQIMSTHGRVIVLDGDKNIVNWDKEQHPDNPVLWNESDQETSTFVDGLVDFDGFRSNMLSDVGCRCDAVNPTFNQPADKFLPLGTTVSPSPDMITSTLLERLIENGDPDLAAFVPLNPALGAAAATGLGDSIGPLVASAILGDHYIPIGTDVVQGPLLQELAGLAGPLDLDALFAAVAANPDLRTGINMISSDFFEQTDLMAVTIALNQMLPTHFIARPVEDNGSATPPTYPIGRVSTLPVLVFYDCQHADGTITKNVDVQQVRSTTSATGTFVSPIIGCLGSANIFAPPLSVGPIIVRTTP